MRGKEALICFLAAAALLQSATAPVKFSGDSALAFTKEITSLGARPSGSTEHSQMQTLIQRRLRSFGCRAETDSWTASTPAGSKPMTNIIAQIAGKSGR